jgi:DNA-binding response OmpR family regulator
MSRTRILVAEDDSHIRRGLVDALDAEGFETMGAKDGGEAVQLCESQGFDLLLLDVMMPVRNGYEVCKALRARDNRIPVLMLTAKGEELDKVLGLELGADDYMTKPFSLRELVARVHALLRRSRPGVSDAPAESALADEFTFGACRIHRRQFTCMRGKTRHELTARELKLVEFFASKPHEVLSRDELLNAAWGLTYLGTTRTLDQHIAQLRKKVEARAEDPAVILTVHGVGYKYVPI